MPKWDSDGDASTLPTALIGLNGPINAYTGFPNAGGLSRLVEGFVMQSEKIVRPKGEGGIGPTTVIAEFHFENLGTEDLHNCAHLSTDETSVGQVAHQSNNGEKFEISHALSFL